MDNAARQEAMMGAGGMMTEFGAEDDLTDLARLTQYADQHLTGWMYWAYKEWNDPTGSNDEGLYGSDARAGHGEDGETRSARAPLSASRCGNTDFPYVGRCRSGVAFRVPAGPAAGPTDVFVGGGSYPNGFTVSIEGGTSRPSGGSHVLVSAAPHVSTVTVTVRPRS